MYTQASPIVKNGIVFCLLFMSSIAIASPKPTVSCTTTNVKMKGKLVQLNTRNTTSKNTIYLINNKSKVDVSLDHAEGNNPHAGAGWGSSLSPGKWSALSLSKPKFNLSCTLQSPGEQTQLKCAQIIKVCETSVKEKVQAQGNYWLAENKSWEEILAALENTFNSDSR